MAIIAHSITIARNLEDVFSFVADLRNDEKWWEPVNYTEKITAGDIDVGTQFKQYASVMFVKVENRLTVTDWNPPTYAHYLNKSQQLPFSLRYEFEDINRETKYTLNAKLETKGVLRLLNPLTIMTLNRQLKQYFNVLKQILERGNHRG